MGYKQYCKDYENIENYYKAKADNFNGWNCHHRLETHTSDGKRRDVDITTAELKALDMYYNRPSDELVFLKISEHTSLHMKGNKYNSGKHLSAEHKRKISEATKGKNNPMYGKKHRDDTKNKMSEKQKGENNQAYGKHWYNNGEENKYCYECPEGFVPGMLKRK